jgi:predicted nucleotidyltransferase
MKNLEEYIPVLIGSVWRGTINCKSDIDIAVYHDEPDEVLKLIRQNNFKVTQTERTTVTKQGIKKASFHIYLESPTHEKVEVIVRSIEEIGQEGKCETYGDPITGLHIQELEKVLEENPTQRFVPF